MALLWPVILLLLGLLLLIAWKTYPSLSRPTCSNCSSGS